MLKRKVILSKDSVLWYAGDAAASLAVVESGKLGVRTGTGLVSVLRPNMVLGDTSILGLEGRSRSGSRPSPRSRRGRPSPSTPRAS